MVPAPGGPSGHRLAGVTQTSMMVSFTPGAAGWRVPQASGLAVRPAMTKSAAPPAPSDQRAEGVEGRQIKEDEPMRPQVVR